MDKHFEDRLTKTYAPTKIKRNYVENSVGGRGNTSERTGRQGKRTEILVLNIPPRPC